MAMSVRLDPALEIRVEQESRRLGITLAVESGVTDIMTVDGTDFSRFRLPRGKAFTLL